MNDNEDAAVLLINQSEEHVDGDNDDDPAAGTTNGGAASSNQQASDINASKKSSCLLLMCASMAALGGLLFGYDVGIISTALPQIKREFHLTCSQEELVVSVMLFGALSASLFGGCSVDKPTSKFRVICDSSVFSTGQFIDRMGSRMTIIVNAGVFIVGAVILTFSQTYPAILGGRFVVGFAVALSAVSECMYIAEISADHNRGMLVSLNELGITVGFLLAYTVGLIYVHQSDGWRYMFGLSVVPAAAQLVSMIRLPDSPQYLVLRHRDQEADSVVRRLRNIGDDDDTAARQELTNIRLSVDATSSASAPSCCTVLLSNKDNLASCMLIGAGLVMAQQLTGQPSVLFYAPKIFNQVGFCGSTAATLATVLLGVVKVHTLKLLISFSKHLLN